MIEANRYKLGIFVLIGLILAFTILFILGLSKIFESKIQFMTVFNESVQGLDIGASVKYRGVTIGQVKHIAISPQIGTNRDNLVAVKMEALLNAVMVDQKKYHGGLEGKENFFYRFFTQEVKKGLRCRLNLAGITGMKYVEIDYFDPKTVKDEIQFNPPEGTYYLPSTPSMLNQLTRNLTRSVRNIASIDFKKIADEMQTALVSLNRYLNDPKINKLIEKLDSISENLEATSKTINSSISKETIKRITDKVENSLESIDEVADELKKQLKAANLGEVSNETMNTLKAITKIRNEIAVTLDTITEFVNSLDDDPGALLRGKQAPEIFPPKE